MSEAFFLDAQWPAPTWIRAGTTLRFGGVSESAYASLNLGTHVGDKPEHVHENRERVARTLRLPSEPVWLNQIHGTEVIAVDKQATFAAPPTADASVTAVPGVVCAALTAEIGRAHV